MGSIIDRIDRYIDKVDEVQTQTTKENALKIIDMIRKEDIEFSLMLNCLYDVIENYYEQPNELAKTQFKNVLEFYDIIINKLPLAERRTTLTFVEGQKIRNKREISCKDKILELL